MRLKSRELGRLGWAAAGLGARGLAVEEPAVQPPAAPEHADDGYMPSTDLDL